VIRPVDDPEGPSQENPIGVFLVRGDNVVLCGLVNEELDSSIDWTKVHGEKIRSTKRSMNEGAVLALLADEK
jgi:U6 snRNA-associated Sm-like protein LSm8